MGRLHMGGDEKPDPGAVALDIIDAPSTTAMQGTSIQGGSTWTAVLKDAVRSGLGLVAAEVWLDAPSSSAMRRPGEGYYGDPVYRAEALDFLAADAGLASPGVGLAGILLSTASKAGGKAEVSTEWTQLRQLENDEDSPNDPRLVAASKLFGFATAVAFDGGLLIVFSRSDAVLAQLK